MSQDYINFNKSLKNFLRCSIEAFPEIKEFKLCLHMYKLFKTFSKKKPCQYFKTIITPYREQFLQKDEAYFYRDDLDIHYSDFMQDVVNVIQRDWRSLNQETKDVFWKHMHLMILLSDKCD